MALFTDETHSQCGGDIRGSCSMINVSACLYVFVCLYVCASALNDGDDDLFKRNATGVTSLTDGSCGDLSPSSRPWPACSVCLSTCPDCSSC